MRVKDCVALVTGGASGLGEATVRRVVEEGGQACILDMAAEAGDRLARELGSGAVFARADVTDPDSVRAALDKANASLGPVNVVVNCAGISIGQRVLGKSGPHDLEAFQRVIQINLVGTFNMIRLAGERMVNNPPNVEGERGVIVNTASIAAFEGQIGQAAYSASKGGVVGMTLPIAREFAAWGIRVVAVAPGIFKTPMFGGLSAEVQENLGKMVPFPSRLGKPVEYALLVQSVIENPLLNGCTIRLDGGLRMPPK